MDLAIGADAARWADGSAGAGVPRDLLWRSGLPRAVDDAVTCGPPSALRPPLCFSAGPLPCGGLSRRSGGRRGAGVGAVGAGRVGPWARSAPPVEHLQQGDLTRRPSGRRGASIAVVATAALPPRGGDGGDRWLVPWQRTAGAVVIMDLLRRGGVHVWSSAMSKKDPSRLLSPSAQKALPLQSALMSTFEFKIVACAKIKIFRICEDVRK